MTDARRRQWVAVDVHILDSQPCLDLMDKCGPAGPLLFHGFLYACKRNSVQGQISFGSDADALALMGLPGLKLVNHRGETHNLDTFWRVLGHHKVTKRRRRGRVTDVICTKWAKWQQTPLRGDGGSQKPTSGAGNTGSKPKENKPIAGLDIDTDIDNDNETDKDTPGADGAASNPVPTFDDFWVAYPRKVDKGHARNAWKGASKKADPATIVAGASRLAADPNLPAEKYIPHPGTWLNGERWDDGPLASVTGASITSLRATGTDAGKLATLERLRGRQ